MVSRTRILAALCLASVVGTVTMYAAPLKPAVAVHAFFKTKLVKFALRNDSGDVLQLQCGDQQMTVENGKTLDLQLPVGAQVTTKNATKTMAQGATVASVTTELEGATIVVH